MEIQTFFIRLILCLNLKNENKMIYFLFAYIVEGDVASKQEYIYS